MILIQIQQQPWVIPLLTKKSVLKVILTSSLPIQILSVLHDSTFNYVGLNLTPPQNVHFSSICVWHLCSTFLLNPTTLHFIICSWTTLYLVFSTRLWSPWGKKSNKLINNPSYGKTFLKYRKPDLSILFLTYQGHSRYRSLQKTMYHLINSFIFIHQVIIKGSLSAKQCRDIQRWFMSRFCLYRACCLRRIIHV